MLDGVDCEEKGRGGRREEGRTSSDSEENEDHRIEYIAHLVFCSSFCTSNSVQSAAIRGNGIFDGLSMVQP